MGRNTRSILALGALLALAGACKSGDDDDGNMPTAGNGMPTAGSGMPTAGNGMPTAGNMSTAGTGNNNTGGKGGSGTSGTMSTAGSSGGGDSGSGGSAGSEPPAMVDCSSRGGDPMGSCADSASGTFAIKTEVDVWWAQDTPTPIVDPGRGKITVYLMGKLSGVCADGKGMGDIKGCGTELPPFVSYAACDAFQIQIPDEVWDKPTMPHFNTMGNTSGFEPGDTLAIDIATGLVGIKLENEGDPWPTPAQTGTFTCGGGKTGEMCFPDDDGDGKPGITIKMGKLNTNYSDSGCGDGSLPVVYRGAPFDAITGVFDDSVRAETLYIGLRTRLGGMGEIGSDCKSGAGDAVAEFLDSRVWNCIATDGHDCTVDEAKFIDEQAPVYNILKKDEKPPTNIMKSSCECPGGCAGDTCPLDQTPSKGARSAIVRLGDLDEDFDCAAVRAAAFPAL